MVEREGCVPLYEYQCATCGNFEVIQKFSDSALQTCPTCGRPVQKLPSAPAFHLKGSGWYVTDYARQGKPAEGGEGKSESAKPASESKPAETKPSTPAAPASSSSE